jgi:hypothetical protein
MIMGIILQKWGRLKHVLKINKLMVKLEPVFKKLEPCTGPLKKIWEKQFPTPPTVFSRIIFEDLKLDNRD